MHTVNSETDRLCRESCSCQLVAPPCDGGPWLDKASPQGAIARHGTGSPSASSALPGPTSSHAGELRSSQVAAFSTSTRVCSSCGKRAWTTEQAAGCPCAACCFSLRWLTNTWSCPSALCSTCWGSTRANLCLQRIRKRICSNWWDASAPLAGASSAADRFKASST